MLRRSNDRNEGMAFHYTIQKWVIDLDTIASDAI